MLTCDFANLNSMDSASVDEANPDKLIEAIDIVLNCQLKENHDDTLIEQLISLIENVTKLSRQSVEHLKDYLVHVKYHLGIDPCILRILSLVISNSDVNDKLTCKLVDSFTFLAGTVSPVSSLSWQASLLHGLNNLLKCNSCHLLLQQTLLPFVTICSDLLHRSSSYIIKRQSEKVLVYYFKALKANNYNDEDFYVSINKSLSCKVDCHLLNFYLENLNEIPDQLLNHIKENVKNQLDEIADGKPADEEFLSSLASLCGATSESKEVLITHLNYWLKRSNLPAVICLVKSFEKQHPGTSGNIRFLWFLYPLVAQYGLTTLIQKESEYFSKFNFEKHWIEQRVNPKIALVCLNWSRESLVLNNDEEKYLVITLLRKLIIKLIEKKTLSSVERKSSVSTFDFILNLCHNNKNLGKEVCDICKEVTNIIEKNQLLLLEYSKYLHQHIKECICIEYHSLCYLEIINLLLSITRFNQPLVTWQDELEGSFSNLVFEENNSELNINLMEYLIESVVHIYIHYYYSNEMKSNLTTCDEKRSKDDVTKSFVKNFSNLWSLHKSNVSFITLVMPLLVIFNYNINLEEKLTIGFNNDDELVDKFVSYFDKKNLLYSIVNTIELLSSTDAFILFNTKLPQLYKKFTFKVMCKLIELFNTTVDDELKVKSLECVEKLLSPMKKCSLMDKLVLLYNVGFLQALHCLMNGLYDGTNIRQVAFKSMVEITSKMDEIDLDRVKCILKNLPQVSPNSENHCEPEAVAVEVVEEEKNKEEKLQKDEDEKVGVNGNSKHLSEYTSEFKRSVIEEMFKDFDSIPTQDILCELSARVNSTNSLPTVHISSSIDLEELLDFFSSFDPSAVPCEPLQVPPQGILDDIINAKSSCNSTIPDCY